MKTKNRSLMIAAAIAALMATTANAESLRANQPLKIADAKNAPTSAKNSATEHVHAAKKQIDQMSTQPGVGHVMAAKIGDKLNAQSDTGHIRAGKKAYGDLDMAATKTSASPHGDDHKTAGALDNSSIDKKFEAKQLIGGAIAGIQTGKTTLDAAKFGGMWTEYRSVATG